MAADSNPRRFSDLPHALLARNIFSLLSPSTLAVASCVSSGWRDLAAEQCWRELHHALWAPSATASVNGGASWQNLYSHRQAASRAWLGRPVTDKMAGNTHAVKACVLLPQQGCMLTGGVDRCVRAWDLHTGTQMAASRRHAGTVRCLAADASMLASGSGDHCIRIWAGSSSRRRRSSGVSGVSSAGCRSVLPFDLGGERAVLTGHAGPVSSLQLAPSVLIRWERAGRACRAGRQWRH